MKRLSVLHPCPQLVRLIISAIKVSKQKDLHLFIWAWIYRCMSFPLLLQGTDSQRTKHTRRSVCLLNTPLLPGPPSFLLREARARGWLLKPFVFPIPTKLLQSNIAWERPSTYWVLAWQGSSNSRSRWESLQQRAEPCTAEETGWVTGN